MGTAVRTFARSTTPYPASKALEEAGAQEEHPLVHKHQFSFLSRIQHRPCQGRGQQGQLLGPVARRAITHLTQTTCLKALISSLITGCWSQNRTQGSRYRCPPRVCTLGSRGSPGSRRWKGILGGGRVQPQGMDGAAGLGAAALAGAAVPIPGGGSSGAPDSRCNRLPGTVRLRAPAPTAAPHRGGSSGPDGPYLSCGAGRRRLGRAWRRHRYRRGRGPARRLCPRRSRPSCSRGPPAPPAATFPHWLGALSISREGPRGRGGEVGYWGAIGMLGGKPRLGRSGMLGRMLGPGCWRGGGRMLAVGCRAGGCWRWDGEVLGSASGMLPALPARRCLPGPQP